MRTNKLLIIPLIIISTFCYSQNLSREVIASQGNFDQIEHITLEWTLGDSFIETLVAKNNIITQGFQQPSIITTARLNNASLVKKPSNIILYPNPVDALLHVYIKPVDRAKLNISLYDVTGKFIKKATTLKTDNDITLDVSELASGIYLLKFSNTDGSILETHRIVKY